MTNRDSGYQAIRLRGLAGLVRAGAERLDELTNLDDVAFFLAETLDDMAEALDGAGHTPLPDTAGPRRI